MKMISTEDLNRVFDELTDSQRAYLVELIERYFIEKDVREYLEDWGVEFEEEDVLAIADDVYDNYNYTEYFEPCIDGYFESKED